VSRSSDDVVKMAIEHASDSKLDELAEVVRKTVEDMFEER
jgi:hypothetical protein